VLFNLVAGEFKDGWMHGKGIYTVKGRMGGAQDASGKAGVHVFEGDYLDGARDGQVFASAPACLSATPSYAVPPDVERHAVTECQSNRHRKQIAACCQTHIFDTLSLDVGAGMGCGPGGALARPRSLCGRLTWRIVCVCFGCCV